MQMDESQLQLRNWHLKLTNLTNSFVVQTSKFFKHCSKVEKQFSQTSRHLQDEKKRLAEREHQINRIVASIESFLQVDIPIDELYTAVPEAGSDVDPFLSALTRRLSLGLDLELDLKGDNVNTNTNGQITQQQQCQSQCENQSHRENRLTSQEKKLLVLLQKENEEKSTQINSLLGQIEQSDVREKRLHRLAEKFTALATDFERILNGNENIDSDSSSSYQNSEQSPKQEEIPTETETETEDEDDENPDSWNDLMTAIEQASQDLQSYCDYRRNPLEIFKRNYVHFQETPFCTPFNQFLHLVESEFIHLWKKEDRREIYENVRKIDMGCQTDQEQRIGSKRNQKQDQTGETTREISRKNLLEEEKYLVENKLAHLSKLENSLQLRECELRLQETEFKRRVCEFSREKTQWETKKKQEQEKPQLVQSSNEILAPPSARSSMSLNDLMESNSNWVSKKPDKNQNGIVNSSILLSPPPDLRAASFDRHKRFPHFHLLRDRYKEISNCAKSSGLQTGFNRFHFYASRMNDILNYFSGESRSFQLSEQLESHKFVSVIKAHYGVQMSDLDSDSNLIQNNLASCLASESQKIVAIGYGKTALEATEKAVQLTHDSLFSQKSWPQDGFPVVSSSSLSGCLLNPTTIKVKMKEKEEGEENHSGYFSHASGDAPLINID